MVYYVGIDPSITNTGMVILDSEGNLVRCVNSKDHKVSKSKFASLDTIERYAQIADYVTTELAFTHKSPEAAEFRIVYEDYAYDATHKAYSLAEFNGILKYMLSELGNVQCTLVAPTIVKRFATGNGGAGKEAMMLQAQQECKSMADQSNDVCDAFFMAKMSVYRHDADKAIDMDAGNKFLRHRLEMMR